jgi:hypothetical protein
MPTISEASLALLSSRCENAIVSSDPAYASGSMPGRVEPGAAPAAPQPSQLARSFEAAERHRWLAPGSALAAILLGLALQQSNGFLEPTALGLAVTAFALLFVATVDSRPLSSVRLDRWLVPVIAALGVAVQTRLLLTARAGIVVPSIGASVQTFHWAVASFALAGTLLALRPCWPRWTTMVLLAVLVGAHFWAGRWVIVHAPTPPIDVWIFHRTAVSALHRGINPYAITFPNIFGGEFYGPGLSSGNRLLFGYPYFPLTLLAVMPGQILGGDPRYSMLVAMEIAAVLMVRSRSNGFGTLAAVLYLTTPRSFFVLEEAWTEPVAVLGLALVTWAACRDRRWLPWLFGSFVVIKQYLVLVVPAVTLLAGWPLRDRAFVRFAMRAAIAGAVLTIPFFLWNPAAFWQSVVALQLRQPFRGDALSLFAWWASNGHEPPSSLVSFVAVGIVMCVALWRLPRTAAGFAAAVTTSLFAFFLFNKQAFCNYYFFVIGACCVTLSACVVPEVEEPTGKPGVPMRSASTAVNWSALMALAIAVALPLVWPGDVPFINDEPMLIVHAADANAAGHLAQMGLMGTFGFIYGPLPTWLYQALLLVRSDLLDVAWMHALVMAGVTGAALWWLSRSLGLWAWFAPLPLLSPYFWFYARALWDNPLMIPLGALTVAGYAAYLASRSSFGLRLSIAAAAAIPLVHLMGVALVVPLAAHMVLVRGRGLLAHWRSIVAIVVGWLVLAWPYASYLSAARGDSPPVAFDVRGWLFPLSGGQLLSAEGLQYFYGPAVVAGPMLRATSLVSLLAYVLVWVGMLVAAGMVVWAARSRAWTARTHIALVVLGALACQSVIHGISARFEHPHYHNGAWIAFVLLAWFAVDACVRRGPVWRWTGIAATCALAVALVIAAGTVAVRLHSNAGTREVYGPTLENQVAIAQALSHYAPTSDVQVFIDLYRRYPHTLAVLRQLHPSENGAPERALDIRYRSIRAESGAIVLLER